MLKTNGNKVWFCLIASISLKWNARKYETTAKTLAITKTTLILILIFIICIKIKAFNQNIIKGGIPATTNQITPRSMACSFLKRTRTLTTKALKRKMIIIL
jgi:hypothetical protein